MCTWLASDSRQKRLFSKQQRAIKRTNEIPVAEVYLSLSDPYSFMLVQVLPQLAQRFNVEFRLYMVFGFNTEVSANSRLYARWALKDANAIAKQYQLITANKIPDEQYLSTAQQEWQLSNKSIDDAVDIFKKAWLRLYEEFYQLSTPVISAQMTSQQRQRIKGHFMPATILFAEQWFWGLDRLKHLEQLFNQLSLSKAEEEVIFEANKLKFLPATAASKVTTKPSIKAYLSLRSPYSYLGFKQLMALAEHYQCDVDIEIVMPMIMRGLPVSRQKQKLIFLDAVREAKTKQIPLTQFFDPAGDGVLQAYQLFAYAKFCDKAAQYLGELYKAVYVEGTSLTNQANLKAICATVGIDYQTAVTYGRHNDWQKRIEHNALELESAGFWGVPVFQYRDTMCWGQDRLWQIEQALYCDLYPKSDTEDVLLSGTQHG